MLIGKKIRLYPTKEQERQFFNYAGAARFSYNQCLAELIRMYQEEGYTYSKYELINYADNLKYMQDYSWLKEVSSGIPRLLILCINLYRFKKAVIICILIL